jgi:CDP-glucose 4,6-dehydratase
MEDLERLNFWKGRRVLVTGATGVVGLNLVNTLDMFGAEVVTIVRDWVPKTRLRGSFFNVDSPVVLVRGELEDFNLLMRTMAEYEIQYIFHLGAQTLVGVGNVSPLTTFKANIEGTWNLLEAARVIEQNSPQFKSICIASSDKAYGSSKNLPYTEDMPLSGEHPYDVSKSCCDLIAQSYGVTYSLPISIARMGNIYGPGDLNFNRVVPGTIRSILEGKAPQIRSDGTPVREYFYVDDAVDAYLTMAEQTMHCRPGSAYNFSSGEKRSVLEVINAIISLMNSDLKPVVCNTAHHEIQDQYLSIRKAENELQWKPRYSLNAGLIPTIEWYKKVIA